MLYYNENCWQVHSETGHALFRYAKATSGLCGNRKLLLEHYRKRVEMVEKDGFSMKMGFEPGTHTREARVDDLTSESWMSPQPNIDIRHGKTLTPTRWKKEEYRQQKYTRGWTEAEEVPGWGKTGGCFKELLVNV
jgi:hypothetical protein